MNIVQLQEQLKNFSQDQLVREMQMPSGSAPQFLVLGEIMRRQKMQQDFSAQQAKGQSQSTVAEDAVAAAGVPQGGIASMAKALAPQTDMAESTGVQAMAYGGPVKKMAEGDKIVRGGKVLIEQEDGTYRDEQGRVVRSVGEDILSGLATLRGLPGQFDAAVSGALRDDALARVRETMGENALSMRAGPDTSYRYPEVPAVDVSAMDRVGMALEGRSGFSTGMPTPQQLAMAAAQPSLPPAPLPAFGPDFEYGGRGSRAELRVPYLPGPAAATELNLPAFRRPAEGAGIAAALRSAAGNPTPPVPPTGPVPEAPPMDFSYLTEGIGNAVTAMGDVVAPMSGVPSEFANKGTPRADRDQQGAAAVPTAKEIEDERRAAEQPTQPAADTTPPGDATGSTGSTGSIGSIAGAGGMSSYEQELMDMLNRREKAAEQDKWLALAQVGLNMMSSTQPTLLGAIGEAGVKGVEAARSARDQYDKDRLDLLGALEQSRQSRAAAAAKAARGASSGGIGDLGISAGAGRLLTQMNADIERLSAVVNDPLLAGAIKADEATPEQEMAYADAVQKLNATIAAREAILYGGAISPQAEDGTTANLSD